MVVKIIADRVRSAGRSKRVNRLHPWRSGRGVGGRVLTEKCSVRSHPEAGCALERLASQLRQGVNGGFSWCYVYGGRLFIKSVIQQIRESAGPEAGSALNGIAPQL